MKSRREDLAQHQRQQQKPDGDTDLVQVPRPKLAGLQIDAIGTIRTATRITGHQHDPIPVHQNRNKVRRVLVSIIIKVRQPDKICRRTGELSNLC